MRIICILQVSTHNYCEQFMQLCSLFTSIDTSLKYLFKILTLSSCLLYLQATCLNLTMGGQIQFYIRFSKCTINFLWVENFRFQSILLQPFVIANNGLFLIKFTLTDILNNFVTLYTSQKLRTCHGHVSCIGRTQCQLLPRYVNNFSFI